MSSKFNEDSRVKLPALMHLCSLGYEYVSEKGMTSASAYDTDTNIIKDIFKAKVSEFNPTINDIEIEQLFDKIKIILDNDDLGREFYGLLTSTSGIKLIDFERPERNSFVCVTEFTCKNGEEEFRPDITLLVNGLPLGFIEVKKPNNKEGM